MSGATEYEPAQVERRLAERERTGSIHALWPDVPYAARRAAQGSVRRLVTAGVTSSRPLRLEGIPEPPARAVGIAAFVAGVGPLLGWWLREGRLDASGDTLRLLADHLMHCEERIGFLREQVATIVRAMRARGVDPILLKGLHTGGEFFPEPATRPASDIDLLVHPTDRQRAEEALWSAGFSEVRRTVFASRSEWRADGSPTVPKSLEVDHAANPWSVDLHFALDRWYFRGLRCSLGEGAFETSRRLVVNGESTRVLDQPHLTAFLALHAGYSLGEMQLVRLLDVALSARADSASSRLDWDRFSRLLEVTQTDRFTYPGLALAESLVPGSIPADVLRRARRRVTRRMLRVIDSLQEAELGPLPHRTLAMKLAWSSGPRELAMNVTDVLVPSDDAVGGLVRVYRKRLALIRRRLAWRAPS